MIEEGLTKGREGGDAKGRERMHLDEHMIDVFPCHPRVVAGVEAHPANEVRAHAGTLAFLQDPLHRKLVGSIFVGREEALCIERDPLVVCRCPALEVHLDLRRRPGV